MTTRFFNVENTTPIPQTLQIFGINASNLTEPLVFDPPAITVNTEGRILTIKKGTGGSGILDFNVAGDAGTIQVNTNGQTITFTGDNGISTAVNAINILTITLDNTAVTPGQYVNPTITIDSTGRITSATSGGSSGMTDWIVGADTGVTPQTITDGQQVNILGGSGIQTTGLAVRDIQIDLEPSGATAGTYTFCTITIDAFGRVENAENGDFTSLAGNPTALIGAVPINGTATTFMRSDAAPALETTGVTPGTYFFPKFTVDAQGRITNAISDSPPTGADPTAEIGSTVINGTATTFMRSDAAPALADTAVTPGDYTFTNLTVDAQGRITAASSGVPPAGATGADPTAEIGSTVINGTATTFMRSDAAPALADTAVTPGDYTFTNLTVDAQGRITAASSGAPPSGATGADPTAECGPTAVNGTATTFMRSDAAPALQDTAVTPGAYTFTNLTVDAQGRITAASSGTPPSGATGADPTAAIGAQPINGTATTFMRSDAAPRLEETGVTPGSYTFASITVDATGRITDASTDNPPTGADPTAQISDTAVNGTAKTFMRSDAAPALADTAVTPGAYTFTNLTVDAQGRITAASNGALPAAATGADPTAECGPTAVNGTAPTFMRSDAAPALQDTAVTPGDYTFTNLTVDAQGRITAASSGSLPPVPLAADPQAEIGSAVIPGTAATFMRSDAAPKIADLGIAPGKLQASSVVEDNIAAGAVATEKIAAGAVTNGKLGDGSVGSSKIAGSAVLTANLAANACTEAKIADDSISTAKLCDTAVTTEKLENGAVTLDKLADASVSSDKIVDGAVVGAKIGDFEIDATTKLKIPTGTSINQILLFDNTQQLWTNQDFNIPESEGLEISAGGNLGIKDLCVGSNKIVDGAVVNSKLDGSAVTIDKFAQIPAATENSVYVYNPTTGAWEVGAYNSGTSGGVTSLSSATPTQISMTPAAGTGDVTCSLQNESINDQFLADGAVTQSKLAAGSVTNDAIGTNTIDPNILESPSGVGIFPGLIVYQNGEWDSTRFRFFWNPVGGLLEEAEVDQDGTRLSTDLAVNNIAINDFESTDAGLSALTVKGVNIDESHTYQPTSERSALYVESGTTTLHSNTLQSTLTLINDKTDSSGDGNKAAVLDLRNNPIKFTDAKYFLPTVAASSSNDTSPYLNKVLKINEVKFDQDTDTGNQIPNLYLSYSNIDEVSAGLSALVSNDGLSHDVTDGVATVGISSIHGDKITDSSLSTSKLADASVTQSKLADAVVATTKIIDAAVSLSKIQDGAVAESKLAVNSVTAEKIADEAIETDHLGDGVVTSAKLADNSVTSAKISTAAVSEDKLGAGVVTVNKIGAAAVSTGKIAANAITSGKIASAAVITAKIQDGAVTSNKLEDVGTAGTYESATITVDSKGRVTSASSGGGIGTGICTHIETLAFPANRDQVYFSSDEGPVKYHWMQTAGRNVVFNRARIHVTEAWASSPYVMYMQIYKLGATAVLGDVSTYGDSEKIAFTDAIPLQLPIGMKTFTWNTSTETGATIALEAGAEYFCACWGNWGHLLGHKDAGEDRYGLQGYFFEGDGDLSNVAAFNARTSMHNSYDTSSSADSAFWIEWYYAQ